MVLEGSYKPACTCVFSPNSISLHVRSMYVAAFADPKDEMKKGVPDCPNKSNPYHECTEYCVTRWGSKNVKVQIFHYCISKASIV